MQCTPLPDLGSLWGWKVYRTLSGEKGVNWGEEIEYRRVRVMVREQCLPHSSCIPPPPHPAPINGAVTWPAHNPTRHSAPPNISFFPPSIAPICQSWLRACWYSEGLGGPYPSPPLPQPGPGPGLQPALRESKRNETEAPNLGRITPDPLPPCPLPPQPHIPGPRNPRLPPPAYRKLNYTA